MLTIIHTKDELERRDKMYVTTNDATMEDLNSDYYKRIYERQKNYYENLNKLQSIKMGSCYNADKEKVTDVWKSFDESTYNFHIVPNERDKETVAGVQQKIKRKLTDEVGIFEQIKYGYGRMPWTRNHWWIECQKDKTCYLILFQTMIIENGELNCYLDRIQFCRYDIGQKGPNMDAAGNFECMYPRLSDGKIEDKNSDNEKNDKIFKCTDIILKDEKDKDKENNNLEKLAGDIVSEFQKFIESCDEK